jgi:hypothetical protein
LSFQKITRLKEADPARNTSAGESSPSENAAAPQKAPLCQVQSSLACGKFTTTELGISYLLIS